MAAVVAVALTAGAVAVFRGGDDDKEPTAAGTATPTDSGTAEGREPAPSDSATEEFPDDDLTDGLPTDDYPTDEESPRDFEDIMPTPSDGPRPAYQMEVGDCFDLPEGKQGQGDPVECSAAHDAEVVHQEKLAGEYDTDAEVRKKADAVCKIPMKDAAEGESSVGGTLVQYPKSTGVSLGMRTVTCSLTAGEGKKLYKSIS
ncbi:hypothetical protein DVA86_04085 [Streptomyces armeniacus]|uniref:Uncharacterized protein n=1 Tax=Streptomyces armeniacus TaxID=83291 RepID=A0A345XJY1_9ACTN|nr:hypothetical protein DVA86_04085 [Streptomyces armeniacus]